MFAWESLITKACENKGVNPKIQRNRENQNVLTAVGSDNQQVYRTSGFGDALYIIIRAFPVRELST